MQKQKRPPFGLRMPADLQDWIKRTAVRENRSANNLIVHLLNEARMAAGEKLGGDAPAADETHSKREV